MLEKKVRLTRTIVLLRIIYSQKTRRHSYQNKDGGDLLRVLTITTTINHHSKCI